MNSTNRVLNRTLLLLAGLVLIGVGGSAILLAGSQPFADAWRSVAPAATITVESWLRATPLAALGHSWLLAVAAVLLLAAAAILVIFVLRQGGGHTRRLLAAPATIDGSTLVEAGVAEQLLGRAMESRPELLSSRVSTYRVRGQSVLKVSVTCRRGVSPAETARTIENLLASLDEQLGARIAAVIQLSGGFRVRASSSTRLQ
ncbi:hypothetical protein [Subtercola frigoramans]|uniref:Alkaline shock response membrane anchor protein AmaP n=1 Tax=Subtercola frigoramans TaxID=120298 RepID=A0ABS2L076_9MICO|nr:hypothetical protein [Subtercola frigoramans]MBM7470449.1 hypothetical protein [Subtercola frigoramans]